MHKNLPEMTVVFMSLKYMEVWIWLVESLTHWLLVYKRQLFFLLGQGPSNSIWPTTKPTAIPANGFSAIPAPFEMINAHLFLANWAVFQETRHPYATPHLIAPFDSANSWKLYKCSRLNLETCRVLQTSFGFKYSQTQEMTVTCLFILCVQVWNTIQLQQRDVTTKVGQSLQ